MRILIVAAGSHGDVLPFIALGRALQRRGHELRLFASAPFAPLAATAGLPFVEVLSAEEYRRFLADRDATEPRAGMVLLAEAVATAQRRCLALLQREHQPGRTLLVGSSLAWATRLIGETTGAPVVTAHLSPSWFRSVHRAPALGPLGHLEWAPAAVKRLIWRGMDRRFLDPLFTAPFNALRAECGLAPVQRVFDRWIHGADRTLAMFPAWFAPPQPDWPSGLASTGFAFDDEGPDGAYAEPPPLSEPLQRFLDAGPAPVVFTAGTANAASQAFFDTSVQACRRSGRRGLLLTQDPSQLPATLPPAVAHVPYAPLQALLPRAAALVHHGGIGTMAQALRAGVPQLIRPMGFDQFDNARHAVRLGVARQLLPRGYRTDTAARALDALLSDPAVRTACAAQAAAVTRERPGAAAAADAVLALTSEGSR